MNSQLKLDKSILQILYYRYKAYIIPFLVIFVCIILLGRIIIPQMQSFVIIKEEEKEYRERINILKKNLSYLMGLSDSDLDAQLKILSVALPIDKDYAGIINAISNVSAKSGIGVGDYSFGVGKLSTESAKLEQNQRPLIRINLQLKGDMQKIRNFLKNLQKRFPLAEVLSVQFGASSATIQINFYYRPLSPIVYNEIDPISSFSKEDKDLINKLIEWQSVSEKLVSSPSSPSSALQGPLLEEQEKTFKSVQASPTVSSPSKSPQGPVTGVSSQMR